jgi:uncharacterized membrane protein required for colicin V production
MLKSIGIVLLIAIVAGALAAMIVPQDFDGLGLDAIGYLIGLVCGYFVFYTIYTRIRPLFGKEGEDETVDSVWLSCALFLTVATVYVVARLLV